MPIWSAVLVSAGIGLTSFLVQCENNLGDTLMVWLLLSMVYTEPRPSQLLVPGEKAGEHKELGGTRPGQLTPAGQRGNSILNDIMTSL